jgi:hypothetical protein
VQFGNDVPTGSYRKQYQGMYLIPFGVTIKSHLGERSTFTVRIARGVTTGLPQEPVPIASTIAIAPPSGAKILHIEDDPGIARSMAMVLGLEGYEVIAAATRDEALEHINVRGLRPDLAPLKNIFAVPGQRAIELALPP